MTVSRGWRWRGRSVPDPQVCLGMCAAPRGRRRQIVDTRRLARIVLAIAPVNAAALADAPAEARPHWGTLTHTVLGSDASRPKVKMQFVSCGQWGELAEDVDSTGTKLTEKYRDWVLKELLYVVARVYDEVMSSSGESLTDDTADRPVLGSAGVAREQLSKAVTEDVWRLQGPELATVLEALDQIRRDTERLTIKLTAEAAVRGAVHDEGFSSVTDYLTGHAPSLPVGEANQFVKVAQACTQARNEPLAAAVASGVLPLRKAFRLLHALAQIEKFVTFEQYLADQQILLPLAIGGTDAELRKATNHLIECARPEADSDAYAAKQHQARSLTERAVGGDMTEFRWRLDPEGAAFVRAAIGPLAKPQPDEDGADQRSPQQRRSDALMMILQRGMGSPGAAPTTSKAKVIITLSWEQLVGQLRGLGSTLTGEQLTVHNIRRLACEADLLPMVLGTDGEVLDLGHQARLASAAQKLVLWREQKKCTYQGCSMPAQWCDAHHAVWWSRGGPTDQDNLYLLCGYHHARVHDRDLTPIRRDDNTIHWQP